MRKTALVVLSLVVVGLVGWVIWEPLAPYISGLLKTLQYEYSYFESPNAENGITVILVREQKSVDSVTKKFIVAGRSSEKPPLKVKHIEFPPETGLVILWLSNEHCRVFSNLPPMKLEQLDEAFEVEMVYDNVQYEKAADEHPSGAI